MNRLLLSFFLLVTSLSASEWDLVYLCSFPRSGNHWVRFLIEEATGIATSSAYQDGDYPHLPTPLPWGGFAPDHGYSGKCRYPRKNEPVVMKTHHPALIKPIQKGYRRAVCLIRNPADAFYSYSVYRAKNKKPPKSDFLNELIEKWRKFYTYWEKKPNVLFIRYEDLYENTSSTLAAILNHIGYKVSPEDIERAVQTHPKSGSLLKHLHHFSDQEILLIKNELKELLIRYEYDF